MHAVLNPASARPKAARRPAPPAPTTIASYSWSYTCRLLAAVRSTSFKGAERTTTGYLLLTKGEASFARSGWLAKTRARGSERCQSSCCFVMRNLGSEVAHQQDVLLRKLWSGPDRGEQAANWPKCQRRIIRMRFPDHPASMTTRSRHGCMGRGAELLTIGLPASLLNDMEDAIVYKRSVAQTTGHQQVYWRGENEALLVLVPPMRERDE
jgi:hypothetical protein